MVVRPVAVIFDNDGLFLDTEAVWTRAERDLFERRGVEFTAADKRMIVGTSADDQALILERRLNEDGHRLVDELHDLVVVELEHGVSPMPGAVELVDQLHLRGTPIGLVSNSPRDFLDRALELGGFDSTFDVVVSAEEVPAPKPAPDPYLEACRQLGIAPSREVVALEDSPSGVSSARAAGLTVVGIPSIEGVELVGAHLVAASLNDQQVRALLGF